MFDATKEYIKENTGVVGPISALAAIALFMLAWTYNHEGRIITQEVKQENLQEDMAEVKMTTQKIYDHLLSR